MARDLLIGVDVGTTGTKVALLDPAAGTVTTESAPVALLSPRPGFAEADPAQWWGNLRALLPALLAGARGGARVAALAVTGMVPALVLVDEHNRPLAPAILQNDARAVVQIERLRAELADLDVVALTGSVVSQQSIGPKHLWLAEHEPALLGRARRLMGSSDWIAAALGAPPRLDENWALESGLFGLDGAPLERVLAASRLARDRLPPLARPGELLGAVSDEAARETGLPAGTPIVAGGADHVLAAYAAGLTEPGDWLVKLGGAGDILAVAAAEVVDRRLYLDHHAVPGLWLPNGCMATSGSLLRWMQQLLGGTALEQLDHAAAQAAPATLICLPYFLGEKSPLHDPDLRGAFLGLHLGHGAADLYRACLEAVAYGMREHVEVLDELAVGLERGVVTNGGSGSALWKQILADVLGRPLETISESGGASLGAAIVAGVGVGLLEDWYEPLRLVRRQGVVEPRPAAQELYAEGFALYRAAREALTPLSHRLSVRQRAGAPA